MVEYIGILVEKMNTGIGGLTELLVFVSVVILIVCYFIMLSIGGRDNEND
jgi:hypothetical protein